MPQLRQPLSSWSYLRSDWRSLKISSSFERGTAGVSETGSPMCCWTRVDVAWVMGASVRHHLAVAFHHLLDEVGAPDDPLALGDEVVLRHVEEVEVGRAAVELRARLVGILDEVVDGLGRAGLHHELLGHALLHEPSGGRGTDHLDVVLHRRGDRGLEERGPELLAVARVG